jgi:hypothetical protein
VRRHPPPGSGSDSVLDFGFGRGAPKIRPWPGAVILGVDEVVVGVTANAIVDFACPYSRLATSR